jgi:hypothetical protein
MKEYLKIALIAVIAVAVAKKIGPSIPVIGPLLA